MNREFTQYNWRRGWDWKRRTDLLAASWTGRHCKMAVIKKKIASQQESTGVLAKLTLWRVRPTRKEVLQGSQRLLLPLCSWVWWLWNLAESFKQRREHCVCSNVAYWSGWINIAGAMLLEWRKNN